MTFVSATTLQIRSCIQKAGFVQLAHLTLTSCSFTSNYN